MKEKKIEARHMPVAPGARVELFRVIYLGGQDGGIRVEVQGFHSRDPAEVGSALAQAADVLADAMTKLMPVQEGEAVPRDAILSIIVGSMVACLVQPIHDDIEASFEPATFRGEASKKGH